MMQQFQLNLGKWEKLHANLAEIEKHLHNISVKSIHQIKLWQFATASFNCRQLQTVLFKDGLYWI